MPPESDPRPVPAHLINPRCEAWEDSVKSTPAAPLAKATKFGMLFGKKDLVPSAEPLALVPRSEDTVIQYPGKLQLAMICIGLILGNFLVALDTSIIATAIPKITSEFLSMDDVSWYGSAYLLTLTAFQPSYGKIFKLFNKKIAYLVSMAIFEIGSLLCAVAKSSPTLIVGRAIAGLGAAGILQGALSAISLSVPLNKRVIYIALVASVFGISACFGPVLGGVLTDKVSWRWCFWINLPIGGASILSNIFFFNPPKGTAENENMSLRRKLEEMDFVGATFIISSVICILLALQWAGSKKAWNSPTIIGLIIGFVILLAVFCIIQWKLGEKATIPPRIFFQRTIFGGAWYFFFMEIVVNAHTYFLPFYFQSVQGASATQSGIRNTPYTVLTIFGSILSGGLVTKVGYYLPFIWGGAIIAAIGSGLVTTLSINSTTGEWAGFQILAGFGVGLGFQLPFAAVPVALSDEDVPIGNAITVFLGQFGGALAIAVTQSVFTNEFISELPKHTTKVDPRVILNVGATNIRKVVFGNDLEAVLSAYSLSLRKAFILPVIAAAMGFAVGWVMEWKSVNNDKKVENTEEASLSGEEVAVEGTNAKETGREK